MTDRTTEAALVTVGHGRLTADAFQELLRDAGVEAVADVRRYPASRRHPQFGREALVGRLERSGIEYFWAPDLGGRRSPSPDSPHRTLRDPSFRAYADHMDTPAFRTALAGVLARARHERVAVLCAESVWWRCHRRLIADAATLLHGAEVMHLFHDGRLQPHAPTAEARPAGDRLVYDRGESARLPGV